MVWYPTGSSLIRAHYEFYAYRLRRLDHARPIKKLAWLYWASNYAHWSMLLLDHPFRHSIISYASGRASCSFRLITHTWSLFARTGYDQVRFLLQLSVHSRYHIVEWCKVRIIRKPFLLLGEWFKFLTQNTGFTVRCLISILYSMYLVFAHGGCCGVYHELLFGLW